MKISLPALGVAIAPAGFGEPQAAAPILVVLVAIELILYSSELH